MMADISLTGVLVVAAIAFAVPLVLGLAPKLHLPSVVLEIVAGIAFAAWSVFWFGRMMRAVGKRG